MAAEIEPRLDVSEGEESRVCFGEEEERWPLSLDRIGVGGQLAAHRKRKEKARIAARARRSQEATIILEMAAELQITQDKLRRIDKATIVKLAIDYIRAHDLLCTGASNEREQEQEFGSTSDVLPVPARGPGVKSCEMPEEERSLASGACGRCGLRAPSGGEVMNPIRRGLAVGELSIEPGAPDGLIIASCCSCSSLDTPGGGMLESAASERGLEGARASSFGLTGALPIEQEVDERELEARVCEKQEICPLGREFESTLGVEAAKDEQEEEQEQEEQDEQDEQDEQEEEQEEEAGHEKLSEVQPWRRPQEHKQSLFPAPKLSTATIFAPKTHDNMNSYFLMIEEEANGESTFVLKPDSEILDEDDLTHLAPQAGDVSISFETDPLDGIPLDDLLIPSPLQQRQQQQQQQQQQLKLQLQERLVVAFPEAGSLDKPQRDRNDNDTSNSNYNDHQSFNRNKLDTHMSFRAFSHNQHTATTAYYPTPERTTRQLRQQPHPVHLRYHYAGEGGGGGGRLLSGSRSPPMKKFHTAHVSDGDENENEEEDDDDDEEEEKEDEEGRWEDGGLEVKNKDVNEEYMCQLERPNEPQHNYERMTQSTAGHKQLQQQQQLSQRRLRRRPRRVYCPLEEAVDDDEEGEDEDEEEEARHIRINNDNFHLEQVYCECRAARSLGGPMRKHPNGVFYQQLVDQNYCQQYELGKRSCCMRDFV